MQLASIDQTSPNKQSGKDEVVEEDVLAKNDGYIDCLQKMTNIKVSQQTFSNHFPFENHFVFYNKTIQKQVFLHLFSTIDLMIDHFLVYIKYGMISTVIRLSFLLVFPILFIFSSIYLTLHFYKLTYKHRVKQVNLINFPNSTLHLFHLFSIKSTFSRILFEIS